MLRETTARAWRRLRDPDSKRGRGEFTQPRAIFLSRTCVKGHLLGAAMHETCFSPIERQLAPVLSLDTKHGPRATRFSSMPVRLGGGVILRRQFNNSGALYSPVRAIFHAAVSQRSRAPMRGTHPNIQKAPPPKSTWGIKGMGSPSPQYESENVGKFSEQKGFKGMQMAQFECPRH